MKIKIFYILLILFLCLLKNGTAQTVIKGKIINKANKPISDASVMIMKTADSSVVAFSFSDNNGDYTIYTDQKEKELLLMVYGFNIKKQIKKIDNQSQKVDFVVDEEAIVLKEFSVKSEKIWGTRDTVNYVVDAFRDSTDIVIGDVLKKMPGIVVKESGQIEYRGKPISNFYIENMDMLQGRYGIATNNITASDIATVQVFENHQPIKALKDIAFTDDAAINLKLKPGAKGIFTGMADIGAGLDNQFLWNSSVTGMYFSKKRQHLAALKTNNTGTNLEQEFQSFTNEDMQPAGSIASIVQPMPPQINKSRYLFNEAIGGTINNLIKTKDEAEITFNICGFRDIDDRKSFDQTRYIIPGEDTVTIKEQMDSHSNRFNIEGGIGYKSNKDKKYLNTRLLFSGNFIESTGNIISDEYIEQNGESDPFKITSSIQWIRRGNNKQSSGTEFYSQSFYQSQPYRLDVSPGTFEDVLNESVPFKTIRQNVNLNSFETRNSLMFLSSVGWKSFRINPIMLFSLEHQSLNSKLSRSLQGDTFSDLSGDSLNNDLTWMRVKAGISLKLIYRKRDFNFELSTPMQYQAILLDDEIKSINSHQNRIIFQPQTNLWYSINTHWEISASWFWYNYNPNLRNLYSGYILQNYRTLSHYESRLSDSYGQQGALKLSYKDIIRFLFTNIEFRYNRYRNEVMYAQEFEGTLMKISAVELENTGNYFSVTARAGKGFNWKKLSINAEASWGKGVTPQLRQDSLIEYKNQGINANMTLTLALTENLQFANKSSWSRMNGSTGAGAKLDPINSFIDAATINYILPNGLIFSFGMEYYDTRKGSRKQNFYLLDAGITYTWKRVRFTLDYNNILNTTDYVYTYYGTLSSYYSEYRIRPASILLSARFKIF
jgi:uncharacterized protein YxjI